MLLVRTDQYIAEEVMGGISAEWHGVEYRDLKVCPQCMGIGKGFLDRNRIPGPLYASPLIPSTCPTCGGAGVIDNREGAPKMPEWFVR